MASKVMGILLQGHQPMTDGSGNISKLKNYKNTFPKIGSLDP